MDEIKEKREMADCCNSVSQQVSEINLLNSKLGYDAVAQLQHQRQQDAQSNSRAWESFNLEVARDNHTAKHLATIGVISAGQTGITENQAAVGPVRTATGDAIVGGVGVSAEQVAANVADLATSMVPVITSALATAISQSLIAVLPALITAVGGASTPSQTTPKA